ncbi:putative D-aminoacylase [Pyronema domesticum]|nr:putative D-aminoacylase [Pyronema domesticum]
MLVLIRHALQKLTPFIVEICQIAGTPGLSLAVLHENKEIYQFHFGYRDVAAKLPTDENTTYPIASLTKAFTSSIAGILVDEERLEWTTRLRDIIPEYKRSDTAANITITDLLNHRTGLPSYDALWLLSNNYLPLKRTEAIPILNYVPAVRPLRTDFIYNNMAYEVIGQTIEKVTDSKYAAVLKSRILEPLGLNRTVYTDAPADMENSAKAYAPLENGEPVEIPPAVQGEDAIIGPAGGIRSSVKDMLSIYKAFMEAANFEIENKGQPDPKNPFKQMHQLWRGMVGMPFSSLREYSYASGWVRAQLPAILGLDSPSPGPGGNGRVGYGLPSRLALLHQGVIPGSTAFAGLFPESSSAVIVLANSFGLADTVRIVGELLIETMFDNNITVEDYVGFARKTASSSSCYLSKIKKRLMAERTVLKPANPLEFYTGRYENSIGNFHIDIIQQDEKLRVSFMGRANDTFDLHTHQQDSFFWILSHNENARLARFPSFPKSYYILKFGCKEQGFRKRWSGERVGCLVWKHETTEPGGGEVFHRKSQKYRQIWGYAVQQFLSKHFGYL